MGLRFGQSYWATLKVAESKTVEFLNSIKFRGVDGATYDLSTFATGSVTTGATRSYSVKDADGTSYDYVVANGLITSITLSPPPPLTYSEKVIADGATGYWKMNDAGGAVPNGTAVVDSIGGANTGHINTGGTFGQTGPVVEAGTALALDGNGNVDVATPGPTGTTGPLSAEIWFSTAVNGTAGLIDNKRGLATAYNGLTILLGSGNVTAQFATGDAGALATVTASLSYAGTGYHHLVATLSRGATDTVTLYIDGASAGTANFASAGGTLAPNAGWALKFGIQANGGNPFTGNIARVAFYPTALTLAQVAAHYAYKA